MKIALSYLCLTAVVIITISSVIKTEVEQLSASVQHHYNETINVQHASYKE